MYKCIILQFDKVQKQLKIIFYLLRILKERPLFTQLQTYCHASPMNWTNKLQWVQISAQYLGINLKKHDDTFPSSKHHYLPVKTRTEYKHSLLQFFSFLVVKHLIYPICSIFLEEIYDFPPIKLLWISSVPTISFETCMFIFVDSEHRIHYLLS